MIHHFTPESTPSCNLSINLSYENPCVATGYKSTVQSYLAIKKIVKFSNFFLNLVNLCVK